MSASKLVLITQTILEDFMGLLISILVDGLIYGMLLFMIAIGLSITMGLMRFINLAHGMFAMFGGYVAIVAIGTLEMPWILGVVAAVIVVGGDTTGALSAGSITVPRWIKC